ncbi:MAG: YlxR family protein [Cyanobacteria bacterium SZAS-4]|nr:YlxR family protein [Cyanobacteria bacterium SZAS-4]
MNIDLCDRTRLCVSCRNKKPQIELIRLTVDHLSGAVKLNNEKSPVHGRSAYLCRSRACVTQALKGGRLKHALEGRKVKGVTNTRLVRLPLESQLIHDMTVMCTDSETTCENSVSKEVLE